MHTRIILLVLALSIGHAAPSFANDVEKTEQAKFSVDDTNSIFERGARYAEVATLADDEMRDTNGAVWPYVIGGGAGLVSYTYSNWDTWNASGAAYATGIGALTGGAAGALTGLAGGGLAGAVAWRPGFMALNYGAQQANPW